MKIATWNIGEDERNDGGVLNLNSYSYIKDMISNKDIDIICLQEAITSSSNLPSIGDYLKENTELKYYTQYELSASLINENSQIGLIISSKYPISNIQTFLFDNPNITFYNKEKNHKFIPMNKGIIMADIKGMRIFTAHSNPFYAFRIAKDKRGQYTKSAEDFIIANSQNKSWLLLGDLNEDDLKCIFPRLTNLAHDLIKEPTYKDKIYDHILVNKRIKGEGLEIVDTYFDHKLCILEVK